MSVETGESGAVARAGGREEAFAEGRALKLIVRDLRLLLAALWLGGAVFFSAVVAPAAFGVLRARQVVYANEAAGSIVTRTLSVVNAGGFVIALLLAASAFLFRRGTTRRAFFAET